MYLALGHKTIKYEVLCDVSMFEFYDVVLGQPYIWKHHIVYESRHHSIIVTLGSRLYRVPEVILTIITSPLSR